MIVSPNVKGVGGQWHRPMALPTFNEAIVFLSLERVTVANFLKNRLKKKAILKNRHDSVVFCCGAKFEEKD